MNHLNLAINNFSNFLNVSWGSVEYVLEKLDWDNDAYWLDDWLELTWKHFVERIVLAKGQNFQPYGYFDVNKLPSGCNILYCQEFNKPEKQYIFKRLASFNEGSLVSKPPFNIAVAYDTEEKKDKTILLEEISFFLGS